MFSFRKSLVALFGILFLVAAIAALLPLVGQGQGQGKGPGKGPRQFYLTQTAAYNGSQALSACAEGYHMASLWELHDPTYLSYNTELGLTQADSGFGPPTGSSASGWIRTGSFSSDGPIAGSANCNVWTGTVDSGTMVALTNSWGSININAIDPWVPSLGQCSVAQRVWCVQD